MRLGGSVPRSYENAEAWAQAARGMGFFACTCPLPEGAGAEDVRDILKAAGEHDIVIAEVGIWRNTMAPDEGARRKNIAYAKERLALAEELGARCCVNVSGARGEMWDGWYPENYAPETRDMLIETTREIIDAVKPKRTFFTLEPMPWMLPDSAESYLALIRDIDRTAFAVHMDFTNMISAVDRFLNASRFIQEAFTSLAPYIKSVHIKDVTMEREALSVTLRECAPGQGQLDYAHILRVIDRTLPFDMPVLLEHMSTEEEYIRAARYVQSTADALGISTDGRKTTGCSSR